MINKKWPPELEAYLIENFSAGNLEEICKYLEKSISAVNKKARALGLSRSKEARSWKGGWTIEEKKILERLFPKTDNEIIAENMNKTVSAIRNKAIKLKLKKSNNYWKIGQEKYVFENYGKIPIDDMMAKLKKTKWGIINKYRELIGKRKTNNRIILSKFPERALIYPGRYDDENNKKV